jgi:hypothetical protein
MTQFDTVYIACSDKRVILMNCKDFEIKKEFETDEIVVNMILTPKYVIMHDQEKYFNTPSKPINRISAC